MDWIRKLLIVGLISLYHVPLASPQQRNLQRENPAGGKKIFCYYSSASQRRKGIGKFLPEDINPNLCSHIIFAFVDIVNGRRLKPFSPDDIPSKNNPGLYARTVALKEKNPDLKVLLAVGGWYIGSKPFVSILATKTNMRMFISNVVRYLRRHNFDGLDMDWEFPGARGSQPEDKFKFTIFMRELQEAFGAEARQSGRPKLILTLATAGGMYYIRKSYETEKIVKIVDYLLLMAYNFHGSWDKVTGHHSALYPHETEVGPERELNQDWSVKYWLSQGAEPERIILGIGTYGMSVTLTNPRQNGIKAPISGGGAKGKYTGETGILAYYEICENLKHGWNRVWMEDQLVPYAHFRNQWVGYDDITSITYKANFINEKALGGAFIWSVEMDDFSGSCGQGRYPLLGRISRILRGTTSGGRTSGSANRPIMVRKRGRLATNSPRSSVNPGMGDPTLRVYPQTRPQVHAELPKRRKQPSPARAIMKSRIISRDQLLPMSRPKHAATPIVKNQNQNRYPEPRTPRTRAVTLPRIPETPPSRMMPISRNPSRIAQTRTPTFRSNYPRIVEIDYSPSVIIRRQRPTTSLGTSSFRTKQFNHVIDLPQYEASIEDYGSSSSSTGFAECARAGNVADVSSCVHFFVCMDTTIGWKAYRMRCPEGLVFDQDANTCVFLSEGRC